MEPAASRVSNCLKWKRFYPTLIGRFRSTPGLSGTRKSAAKGILILKSALFAGETGSILISISSRGLDFDGNIVASHAPTAYRRYNVNPARFPSIAIEIIETRDREKRPDKWKAP